MKGLQESSEHMILVVVEEGLVCTPAKECASSRTVFVLYLLICRRLLSLVQQSVVPRCWSKLLSKADTIRLRAFGVWGNMSAAAAPPSTADGFWFGCGAGCQPRVSAALLASSVDRENYFNT